MNRYTFVPVFSTGATLSDIVVEAESERMAHHLAWLRLTAPQQDNIECLDCVEVKTIRKAS